MRKFLLIPGVALLLFTVACGSGNGSSGNGGFGSGGANGFSVASLSGQYAYRASGFDTGLPGPFREAGVFTADGKGHITSGTDDLGEGSSGFFSDPSTGTYTIASDGTGSITLNFSNASITLALTVASSSKVLLTVPLISGQATSIGSGIALKQDATALTTVPSGNFAFDFHTVSSAQGSAGTVGAFTVNGGVITGTEDVMRGGILASHTITGLMNTPDASGRGTGTFTNDLAATSTFNYYIVDANTIFLFDTDLGINGLGRAEKQSTATFSNSSLSGNYAFGSHGDTTSVDSVNTVGRFTAGGDGTITAGVFDSVQDGTVTSNQAFTGTYSVGANGRAVLNLTPSVGAAVQHVAYLVSPTRAFFLNADTTKVEDGTVDAQQSASFSTSGFTGTFAFFTDGVDGNQLVSPSGLFDRLGTMTVDGAGKLTLNYVLTGPALNSPTVSLSGTYTVATNGRATGSVANVSSNLVFYLVSGTNGYLLQADSGEAVAGIFTKQQ